MAGLALAPRFVQPDFLHAQIEQGLAAASGHPVEIGDQVAFELLPSPQFQVTDLVVHPIAEDGGAATGRPLVTARAVTIQAHPWALLFGQLQAREIELISPQIEIAQSTDGQTDWSRAPLFDALSASGSMLREVNNTPNDRALVSTVLVRDARFILNDSQSGESQEIVIETFSVSPNQGGDGMAFQGTLGGRWENYRASGAIRIRDLGTPEEPDVRRDFSLEVQAIAAQPLQAAESFDPNLCPCFEQLNLAGNLSDHFLDTLEFLEGDGWVLDIEGLQSRAGNWIGQRVSARHSGLNLSGGALTSLPGAGSHGAGGALGGWSLDNVRLTIGESVDALGSIRFQPTSTRQLAQEQTEALAMLDGEQFFGPVFTEQSGHLSIQLNQSGGQFPADLPQILDVTSGEFDALLEQLVGPNRLTAQLSLNGAKYGSRPFSFTTAFDVSDQHLDVDRLLFDAGTRLSANLTQASYDSQQGLELAGSVRTDQGFPGWLSELVPEIYMLASLAQVVTLSGALIRKPGAETLARARVQLDERIDFTTSIADDGHGGILVGVDADEFDLLWLQGDPISADLRGAESVETDARQTLDYSISLANLLRKLGASGLSVRASQGKLGSIRLAQTDITASRSVDAPQLVDISWSSRGELEVEALAQVDFSLPNLARLMSLDAGFASLLSIDTGLVLSERWQTYPFLLPQRDKRTRVQFDDQQGWSFAQGADDVVSLHLKSGEEVVASPGFDLSGKRGPDVPLSSFFDQAGLGRLIAPITQGFDFSIQDLGTVNELRQASGNGAGMQGAFDLEVRGGADTGFAGLDLGGADFQPFADLPAVNGSTRLSVMPRGRGQTQTFGLTFEAGASPDGGQRASQAQGMGNLAVSAVYVADPDGGFPDFDFVEIQAERVELRDLLEWVTDDGFAASWLAQVTGELEMQIGEVTLDGSPMIDQVDVRTRVSTGAIELISLAGTLASGHVIDASGEFNALGGLFGAAQFDLSGFEQQVTVGPVGLDLSNVTFLGEARVNGLTAQAVLDNFGVELQLTGGLAQLSYDNEWEATEADPAGWSRLLASAEGAKFTEQFVERMIQEPGRLGGVVQYRGGVWRSSGGEYFGPLGDRILFEGSFIPQINEIEGTADWYIPDLPLELQDPDDPLVVPDVTILATGGVAAEAWRMLGELFGR